MIALLLLLPPAAYLLGSISFAWIAGRCRGIDLREHGSGNLGATNAGRVLGKGWFVAVFLGDCGKGLLAACIARLAPTWFALDPEPIAHQSLMVLAGVAVVLGHVFPGFHRLRGGKAVATTLGVFIALLPAVAGIAFACWVFTWLLGRLTLRLGASNAVGPASMLAACAAPTAHLILAPDPFARDTVVMTTFVFVLALLIIVKHRSNLARLRSQLRERRAAV